MRVLLVSQNFAPEPTGIGRYSGELAQALVDRGHAVRVVCAPPYYPEWRVAHGHSAWGSRRTTPRRGLDVIRCPVWVPRRPHGAARLLHLASFAASSLPALARSALWKPDLVFVVAPSMATAPGAWLTARLCGASAWLHVQDFELDAGFSLGLLRNPWLRRCISVLERRLLAGFDRVSTLSSRMLQRLHDKGVEPARCRLLPNGIDAHAIAPLDRPPVLRTVWGLQGKLICLFSGTMNRKQSLGTVIEAAHSIGHRTDIVFLLCGNGDQRPQLESIAGRAPNIVFVDLQPPGRLNELLNLADIHLLPQAAGAADLVMPSKLGGMLASGRPVLATASPQTEVAEFLANCALVVPPEDPAALARGVLMLAADPALRSRLGAAGRALALDTLHAPVIYDRLVLEFQPLQRPTRARSAGVKTADAQERLDAPSVDLRGAGAGTDRGLRKAGE